MHIVILDYGTIDTGELQPLIELAETVECHQHTSHQQIIPRCKKADIIVVNKVVLDADILAQLNARLICIAATGTNNVDLVAAKTHKIAVTNVAGYSTMSVVQHTFALIFNLLGNTHRYITDCRGNKWQDHVHFAMITHPVHQVAGKTLGIIGYGAIGQAIKKVAIALGMECIVAERKNAVVREGRLSFERTLQEADILTINTPLNDDTRHLITLREFQMMKPSAFILNTARGGIINEVDLVKALEGSMIAGAATDVLSKEPPSHDNPLLNYQGENLLITPHIAWASREAVSKLIKEIAANIKAFMEGERRNRVA